MTKQKTKNRNTIHTNDIKEDEWSDLVTQVRNTQKKAEITDISINGETAILHYQVQGFPDKQFSQKTSAKIHPESKSAFEQLLEKHGYAPHESQKLIGESFNVSIERTENGIKFDLPVQDTQSHTTSSSQVTKTLLSAGLVGCLPLINIIILAELLYESTQRESFTNLDLVSAIGLTISISLLYVALPVLYYILI